MRKETMDWAAVTYVATCLVYQALIVLMPVKQLLATGVFPLFSKGLAVLGLLLVVVDLLTTRTVLRGRHQGWLFLLLVAMCLSSAVRHAYAPTENASAFVWNAVQMLLLYTLALRIPRERLYGMLFVVHTIVSAVFVPALLYMFYQFATLTHYVVAGMNQGWHEGRLFGVMSVLYYGTMLVAILASATAYLLFACKRPAARIWYAFELIVLVAYLALSDTRTLYAGGAVGVGFFVWSLFARRHAARGQSWSLRAGLATAASVGAVLLALSVALGGIRAASLRLVAAHAMDGRLASEGMEAGDSDARDDAQRLERPQQATITSRRVDIWRDYLAILLDEPTNLLVGLSPDGYEDYIRQHYPDHYVVSFFAWAYPHEYAKGGVYGTHNAYLHVLMTTGVLGLVAVMGFVITCARDVLAFVLGGGADDLDATTISTVVMILVAVLFETDVFLRATATSMVFWVLAGLCMSSVHTED